MRNTRWSSLVVFSIVGASDAAMKTEEMAKVDAGVQPLPMAAGSIVLTYNLDGLTSLKLSRKAYAGMFLGKIKK